RLIAQNVDQPAAVAEQEHGAELRVNAAAENEVIAVLGGNHRLDYHALEGARVGFVSSCCRSNIGKRLHDSIGIANAQSNAADVSLMQSDVGPQLHRYRKAERLCGIDGRLWGRCDPRRDA